MDYNYIYGKLPNFVSYQKRNPNIENTQYTGNYTAQYANTFARQFQRIFSDQYSRGQSGFGLRPLTRDGAASLIHAQNLWGTAYQANKDQLINDWGDFYD